MRRVVVDLLGIHRADDRDIVSYRSDVREAFAYHHAGLPVSSESEDRSLYLEFGSLELSDLGSGSEGLRHGQPMILLSSGL